MTFSSANQGQLPSPGMWKEERKLNETKSQTIENRIYSRRLLEMHHLTTDSLVSEKI